MRGRRFTKSKDGIERCTIRTEIRITRDVCELLERHARDNKSSGSNVDSVESIAFIALSFGLEDQIEAIKEKYSEEDEEE